MNSDDNYSIKG